MRTPSPASKKHSYRSSYWPTAWIHAEYQKRVNNLYLEIVVRQCKTIALWGNWNEPHDPRVFRKLEHYRKNWRRNCKIMIWWSRPLGPAPVLFSLWSRPFSELRPYFKSYIKLFIFAVYSVFLRDRVVVVVSFVKRRDLDLKIIV